ncbi:MAG TPA: HAD family hydrolase [Noviherbaspirillum sp.]|nr:HAD family hydrolase [Noviherbaspirillum sp.]
MRAIFLDKDGTLIEDVPYNVDPALITLSWQAGPALQLLQHLGYKLIVVTNQSGVARGLFTEAALLPVRRRLDALLAQYGVRLDGFYYCPHSPQGVVERYAVSCTCRKPMPGLLTRAAHEHGLDLGQSWMIGDILNDVEAGRRAGCRTVLIDNGNETEWERSPLRVPDLVAPDLHTAAGLIAAAAAADAAAPQLGGAGSP